MKKIVVFFVLAAGLIFYNADTIVMPFLEKNDKSVTDAPLTKIEEEPTEDSVSNGTTADEMAYEHSEKNATLTKEKPLDPAIRDAVRELVNTSHEGLVIEKTDNGVMLNLKGRYRTAPVATIGEDGELTIRDYTAPPPE